MATTPPSTNYDESARIGAKSYDGSFGETYDVNLALNKSAPQRRTEFKNNVMQAEDKRAARVLYQHAVEGFPTRVPATIHRHHLLNRKPLRRDNCFFTRQSLAHRL